MGLYPYTLLTHHLSGYLLSLISYILHTPKEGNLQTTTNDPNLFVTHYKHLSHHPRKDFLHLGVATMAIS